MTADEGPAGEQHEGDEADPARGSDAPAQADEEGEGVADSGDEIDQAMQGRHVPCVAGIDVLVVREPRKHGAPRRERSEAQHDQRGRLEAGTIGAEEDPNRIEQQQGRDGAHRRIGKKAVGGVPEEGSIQ